MCGCVYDGVCVLPAVSESGCHALDVLNPSLGVLARITRPAVVGAVVAGNDRYFENVLPSITVVATLLSAETLVLAPLTRGAPAVGRASVVSPTGALGAVPRRIVLELVVTIVREVIASGAVLVANRLSRGGLVLACSTNRAITYCGGACAGPVAAFGTRVLKVDVVGRVVAFSDCLTGVGVARPWLYVGRITATKGSAPPTTIWGYGVAAVEGGLLVDATGATGVGVCTRVREEGEEEEKEEGERRHGRSY